MRSQEITNKAGETVVIHRSESGNVFCPVCGLEFQNSSRMNIQQVFFGGTEICPSCLTHFHFSDTVRRVASPGFDLQSRWEVLRHRWLERNDWDESLLDRLVSNLGLDIQELRRLADENGAR